MKNILLVVIVAVLAYSTFKRADAVQSIEFRGEIYALSDDFTRSRATVYMYTPGGENFLRAGKYIQVAHLPQVDLPAAEYRKQYMGTLEQAPGFAKTSDVSFFFVEANSLVHSTLLLDDDRFKLYSYAEILKDSESSDPKDHSPSRKVADEFEKTTKSLPMPPRTISTWF